MWFRISILSVLASCVAACGSQGSVAPDPSNPFHCGVAFAVYGGIAESTGAPGAEMLHQLIKVEAVKAASMPAEQRTRAEGEALKDRLMADPDEAYDTVVACMKRLELERAAN